MTCATATSPCRPVRIAVALLACTLALSTAACQSDVRPGVRRTATGKFVNYYNATPDRVRAAAGEVLRSIDLMMIRDDVLSGTGHYVLQARNAQDTRVTIELTQAGQQATQGTIKIAPGWDEGLALRVHQMINDRLK